MEDLIFQHHRDLSLTVECDMCRQPRGEVCTNLITREPLTHQPAHHSRIAKAKKEES